MTEGVTEVEVLRVAEEDAEEVEGVAV